MNEDDFPHIALAGNPNCGKSTIFNALTGLRQKIANYPGVTVEKKEGILFLSEKKEAHLIDLPGTYSLNPRSLDEQVTHDIILGLRNDTPRPKVIISVVDASNLERNLFLTTQLLGAGVPMVVALNMMDLSRAAGLTVDPSELAMRLGIPVIPMSANRGQGLTELKRAVGTLLENPIPTLDPTPIPVTVKPWIHEVASVLTSRLSIPPEAATGEALRMISSEKGLESTRYASIRTEMTPRLQNLRKRITESGRTWHALEAELRYEWIESVLDRILHRREIPPTINDRLDRILTHRIMGPVSLLSLMFLVFMCIFSFSSTPMNWIDNGFSVLGTWVQSILPEGPIRGLLSDGIISGVGSIMIFLPQIMILFFFIAILEDTGYMARAAFIMDRIMGKFGLHGKAFIPLLSSFACAIPGVMSTRTIENDKDRLVTILVAPLMCCSARWPVYILLCTAFIPNRNVFGFIPLQVLVILGLVLSGVVLAILIAGILKRTLFKGETPPLILELPPYRIPSIKSVLRTMLERGWLFTKNAGTVILAISIVLWVLASYPKVPDATPDQQIRHSFAGKIGHTIEPMIKPIGFDWKLGVAIIASFAAREVFVSSMGTIYGMEVQDDNTTPLKQRLAMEKDPETGDPFFTPLRALSIMVYYVIAMQCMSTVAAVKRETGGWKWPLFQLVYMSALAWVASFVIWQGGQWLGYH